MKVYIPGVSRVHFYDDGWLRADVELVSGREKIGFDSGGLWVDINEENVEEMRRLRAKARFRDNLCGDVVINKGDTNENL